MNRQNIIFILLIVISLVMALVSGISLISIFQNETQSNELYHETEKTFIKSDNKPKTENPEPLPVVKEWYEDVEVDIESLYALSNDIVGFLYFENEDIRYPVMYSGDNDKYLRMSYDGTYANAGSIFLEGANNRDLNDAHSIIYGHNMQNLSMFGKLKYYYRQESYYSEHKYFRIYKDDRVRRYEIIVYGNVSDSSDIYAVFRENDDRYRSFVINTLIPNLKKVGEIDTENVPQIVTLSTCSYEDTMRFVVCAKLINEHAYTGE